MSSRDLKTNFELMRDRILAQQSEGAAAKNGSKEFWRSMEELTDSNEFQEFVNREFPQHAEEWNDPVERRAFLKLMGASLALAGLSGCAYQPPESIVPYVQQPNEIVPGKALYYATAFVMGGVAQGLLARSNEGRPTKLEGNPEHPASLGATDVFGQGSLWTMYDPDRSQAVLSRGDVADWDKFLNSTQPGREGLKKVLADQKLKQGAGLRFLTETVTSPTLAKQIQDIIKEYPQAKWYSYEPTGRDNAHKGAMMAFGQPVNTVYKFDEAARILSLDADFLIEMPGSLRYTKDFMKRRVVEHGKAEEMNRLYVIESVLSLTGAKADHRLALRPSEIEGFARAVAKELGVAGVQSNYTANEQWVKAIAKDLQAHKGKSIVIAGDAQPPIVHALVHAMNDALGNAGKTVVHTDPIVESQDPNKTQLEGLKELVDEMNAGKVEALAILGGNPVYTAPADFEFVKAMDKVSFRVHLGLYRDETSEHCHWHVNEAHFLEMWGDARAYDGTVTFIQPLIEPLYGGKSPHEFLGAFTADPSKKGLDILRAYWQTQKLPTSKEQAALLAQKKEGEKGGHGEGETKKAEGESKAEETKAETAKPTASPTPVATPTATPTSSPASVATPSADFEASWRRVVHDGFIAGSAFPAKAVSLKTDWTGQAPSQAVAADKFEIVFRADPTVHDGRFANNAWLQELPKPLTKLTWDNAVIMSPRTAHDLGLIDKDGWTGGKNIVGKVNVEYQGLRLPDPAPIWVLPGMPDKVALINLGYGRSRAIRNGGDTSRSSDTNTSFGFNAYKIRKSDSLWFGPGNISNTGETYELATTQLHFYMNGRDMLRVRDVEDYLEHPAGKGDLSKEEEIKGATMYPQRDYSQDYKWGMTIDLNNCTGCNACVIACQSENNIPVVGKEQVLRSREMHWLRVDAYFGNNINEPDGPYFMPVLCQQCEQAPCEPVCPVHATTHSAEGLNDMVYNRCVGTRYCSNNCPYKVRRFNFLLYQNYDTPTYKLMRNPEVSVRSRGVMEKCTYCVQRIQAAKIEVQKDGDRKIRDGEIVTACQAVCPADAITFGDLNDLTSLVAKRKKEERNYTILADLNTQPRTSYLASLLNLNKEIPQPRLMLSTGGGSHAETPKGERKEGH
jgi:molybdopterin-containing oxidoreductase family iron-sulfur binding subunit